MKKISKWWCFLLIVCMLCSTSPLAFAEEETAPGAAPAEETVSEESASPKAAWNVMIYLCGTDLESKGRMATANLEMIARTVPDSKVNVLIETGGTAEWQAQETLGIDIATDRLQRWTYGEEGFTLVDEQENASMAKYTTLVDFIRWGKEKYPAEKNMLLLWDHGGGSASGLIVDELHDSAIMSLEGLERALKEGGLHYDLIMTDTCLMASIETAQAVEPYADYLLASEEVLPGMGSNYEEWLQDLYDEPECGPARLGKNICDTTELMYAEYADDNNLKGLTFSVIDLSRISAVAEAFDDYMQEAVGLISDPVAFGQYLQAVNSTDRYMNPEMWDLYDLARRGLRGGISKETVLKLENAVEDAVVTCVRGSYHPYSHGLSAYLVYNGDIGKLDRLARTCRNPWQLAFLDAVNLNWDAPEWVYEEAGEIPELKPELYTAKFDTENMEDQSAQLLHIHSGVESGAFIRYELQRYDEKDDFWYTLGENEDVDLIDESGSDLTFVADFTGKWPAINGQFLHTTTKDVKDYTVLMQGTVLVPRIDDQEKELRILAEYPERMDGGEETPSEKEEEEEEPTVHYALTGLWDGFDSSTGLSNRNTYSMADLAGMEFQVCRPVYSEYLEKIGEMKYNEPTAFSYDLEVEDTVLPAGQYRLRYVIADMMDRIYTSDFVNLTWDGTRAVFEAPPEEEEKE